LFEHDLRANAFRVCREGKPVPTFPDHALVVAPKPKPTQPDAELLAAGRCERTVAAIAAVAAELI